MSIRIGKKGRRGAPKDKGGGNPEYQDYINVDVTSGGHKIIVDVDDPTIRIPAKSLSPLKGDTHPVTDHDYDGQGRIIGTLTFNNFEIWWQANKVYKGEGHVVWNQQTQDWDITPKFWAWRRKWAKETKGKRYLPKKIPSQPRELPLFAIHDGKRVNYLDSRKYYLRKYCQTIKNMPVIDLMRRNILRGIKYMIIDLDGPADNMYKQVGRSYVVRSSNERAMYSQEMHPKTGYEASWPLFEAAFRNPAEPFGHGFIVAAVLLALTENKTDSQQNQSLPVVKTVNMTKLYDKEILRKLYPDAKFSAMSFLQDGDAATEIATSVAKSRKALESSLPEMERGISHLLILEQKGNDKPHPSYCNEDILRQLFPDASNSYLYFLQNSDGIEFGACTLDSREDIEQVIEGFVNGMRIEWDDDNYSQDGTVREIERQGPRFNLFMVVVSDKDQR